MSFSFLIYFAKLHALDNFIYLFVSGNKAHEHHKHKQKKTDRNTDKQIDRH